MKKQLKKKLIGPFDQIVTMANLPEKGSINDKQMEIISGGGIVVSGDVIESVGEYKNLKKTAEKKGYKMESPGKESVCLPGLVDAHTHICFGGSRASDYAFRVSGMSYLEIAEQGGGVWSTVDKTRKAGKKELKKSLVKRLQRHFSEGVTTCEVKSGYGLSLEWELLLLEIICSVRKESPVSIIPTCLAAHICPRDFNGTPDEYLHLLVKKLFPEIQKKKLTNRMDIYVDEGAFGIKEAKYFLEQAKKNGFHITVHGDQFSCGGSRLAVDMGALSVDHLEATTDKEISMLGESNVVCIALPGACMGLGMHYAPARKLLDAGACLAIATDWNPGTAPMGDLLMQASVLGVSEKLTTAETFAAITFRAAKALNLKDRGTIAKGKKADFISFPCRDYKEILYCQGKLKPNRIWKNGKNLFH